MTDQERLQCILCVQKGCIAGAFNDAKIVLWV